MYRWHPKRLYAAAERRLYDRVARLRFKRAQLEKPARTLRVLCIGTGPASHIRAHLAALEVIDGVKVVGICDSRPEGLAALAREFHLERTGLDWEELVEELKPDAAFVLADPLEMHQVAKGLLQRGIPCLLEKPPGISLNEAEDLANVASANGCLNMVGLNRRYFSSIQGALRIVNDHGPLLGVHVDRPEQPYVRILQNSREYTPWLEHWLFVESIHSIDLLRVIGGEVDALEGFKHVLEGNVADGYSIAMRFQSGALGTYSSHWRSPGIECLTLLGEGFRITLQPYHAGVLASSDGRVKPLPVSVEDRLFSAGVLKQDLAFLNAVATGRQLSFPAADLAEACRTMMLIERFDRLRAIPRVNRR